MPIQITTTQRKYVTDGTPVKNVTVKNGYSPEQELMAPLFNDNQTNSVFMKEEGEVDEFNRTTFKVEKDKNGKVNKVIMYKKRDDGKRQITELNFGGIDEKDLKKYFSDGPEFEVTSGNQQSFWNIFMAGTYDKATIDLRDFSNEKATIVGFDGRAIEAADCDLKLINSNIKDEIQVYKGGTLYLENTKGEKGLFFDKPVTVINDGSVELKKDSKSKVK